VARAIFRFLARVALGLLTRLEIVGQENLPETGPLIVVANHFHFADVVAMVRATHWPLEFLGGTHLLDAPPWLMWVPNSWGYYAVHRGGVSRDAMRAATAVLEQDGVLAIYPEGGSWADVLRPARPGVAFLAAETGVPILPIGLDGLTDIFPSLRRGRRAKVTIRIGKPFGPFEVGGRGRERRAALDALGDEIMNKIAELIPPERHGVYSSDPALRARGLREFRWCCRGP
jgi:1-acyl-sn-glycerol-3-phosphate acyltransferase